MLQPRLTPRLTPSTTPRVCSVLLVLLCACGPSIHEGAVRTEAPIGLSYDLSHPLIDSDDAVADALLLLPLLEGQARREQWFNALASRVLEEDTTDCDRECGMRLAAILAESQHAGVQLAMSQEAGREQALATLNSAMRETGVQQERAAALVIAGAIRAYAVVLSVDSQSQGSMLLMSNVPICGGLDARMETADIARIAGECAGRLPSSPDWESLATSTDAILIGLFIHALHQAIEVIQNGESRLARTLVQSGLLQSQMQNMAAPLSLPITPSWVSSAPFREDASRNAEVYVPRRGGFVAHVQSATTQLRVLPALTPGDALPPSFSAPHALIQTSWNEAWAAEEARLEQLSGLFNGPEEGDAELTEEEAPEWLTESNDTTNGAAAGETDEPQAPAEPALHACAAENTGRVNREMNLVVDEDAPASRVLEVLRRASSEATWVTWLATNAQGAPTSLTILVGPGESSEDCAQHLDLSSLQSLHSQLSNIPSDRQLTLASE